MVLRVTSPFGNRPIPRLGLCMRRTGFSLVEVVIALGIVGIAFVPLMGLLPTGLGSFRSSVDRSATARIVERMGNEAKQSDFDAVTSQVADRFFDDQGNEVAASKSIYQARMTVQSDNTHLKRLVIQVARNPGGAITLATEDGLWKEGGTLPVATRSVFLARSSTE